MNTNLNLVVCIRTASGDSTASLATAQRAKFWQVVATEEWSRVARHHARVAVAQQLLLCVDRSGVLPPAPAPAIDRAAEDLGRWCYYKMPCWVCSLYCSSFRARSLINRAIASDGRSSSKRGATVVYVLGGEKQKAIVDLLFHPVVDGSGVNCSVLSSKRSDTCTRLVEDAPDAGGKRSTPMLVNHSNDSGTSWPGWTIHVMVAHSY